MNYNKSLKIGRSGGSINRKRKGTTSKSRVPIGRRPNPFAPRRRPRRPRPIGRPRPRPDRPTDLFGPLMDRFRRRQGRR